MKVTLTAQYYSNYNKTQHNESIQQEREVDNSSNRSSVRFLHPTPLSMVVDYPTLLLIHDNLLTDPYGQHYLIDQFQLAAWTLSGRQRGFQERLKSCCSPDGAETPILHTRVLGLAGVCHGKWICSVYPFLDFLASLFSTEHLQYRIASFFRG